MQDNVLLRTDFKEFPLFRRGKVRDVYNLGDKLLIVSTDRISCFDVVLPCGIPYKGKVLTSISVFWFEFIKDIVSHHYITSDITKYPKELQKYNDQLSGRSMLVKKTSPLPVECIVRGYLSGSGWKEYQKSQSICAIPLPGGLVESAKLPQVIFTPSTKEDKGHDINVGQKYLETQLGREISDKIRKISIAVYEKAAKFAQEKGIIIADTKFEFGIYQNEVMIIDEVLTPDSSRFWPKAEYKKGQPNISFDKQYVRNYLESINWDKNPPAPNLPKEVIEKTSQKYIEAYKRLTGKELEGI